MRIRSIKPEFWRSDDIDALPLEDRLLFIGLWSYVDDGGIGIDKESSIIADLFAGDLSRNPHETSVRVHEGLDRLHRAGLITRYRVSGKRYLYVTAWSEHQKINRPSPTTRPRPTSDNAEITEPSEQTHEPSVSPHEEIPFGAGEQGSRGAGEVLPPTPENSAQRGRAKTSRGEVAIARLNETDRSIQAEQIARAYSENSPTPVERGLLTKVAVEIDRSLKSGIPPQQIADGLRDWHKSSSWSPTQIQAFVHKAGPVSNGNGIGKPSKKALSYQDAAEALLAEMSQP